MSNYDSDDAYPKSPGLQPIKIKSTPSPSPPPFPPQHNAPVVTQTVSPTTSSRRRKRNNRTRPSQGDTVLLSFLDPNRPDIARAAGERALNSDSEPEPSESEDEARRPMQSSSLVDLAQNALKKFNGENVSAGKPVPLTSTVNITTREIHHPDPDTDMERPTSPKTKEDDHPLPSRKNSEQIGAAPLVMGLPTPESNFPSKSVDGPTPASTKHEDDSLATSPAIGDAVISPSQASANDRLPALQNPTSPNRDNTTGSPNQTQSLPPFRHLSEIAEQAAHQAQEQHEQQHRASFSHRPSISSTSPTLVSRVPLNGNAGRSPPTTQFPALNMSPGADIKLSPPSNYSLFSGSRRPSNLSDSSNAPTLPPPPTLTTGSTTEGYRSSGSDAYSPHARPRSDSHRMSIDGITHPNTAQIQHVPPHGSTGFKCDYPGCNAPPFQTQYLLNSHANVHSQARPHYCPVPGCSRGEGGKGFKRKNEMIRHGLVHDSPGYVCPFCPERDHKYPRPDNLQRHVRVHHVDKDKDDPQLREVLAQRPEGGGRGRRRRVNG